ncbi:hypothetical protein B296_00018430 [Ensete ventricosum]|uniref:Isopenicillin N synthase-like Fe(2+) 2OG dioxygenase domain-containing protein n=1 Tax=Ensete ventricosum TaxID=4639 RepID=A0A426ZUX2_ENSVE|nr:hypothetical protein B296_00018430 [Ensete ventricosum]
MLVAFLKATFRWLVADPRLENMMLFLDHHTGKPWVLLLALSNGRYRSVWHRAVVNSDRERISVASFLCPCNSVVINPPEKLVGDGDRPVYRTYTYDEYYKKFWSRNLDDDHCLELFES